MFDPFVSMEEVAENVEFIESNNIITNAYAFNDLDICEGNIRFWQAIKQHGLIKNTPQRGIYCDWNFKDDTVNSLFSIVQRWESARGCHYQALRPLYQNVNTCDGQLNSLQIKYGQLNKITRVFDFAFLKTILLCFKEIPDPKNFLAGGLSRLDFDAENIFRLADLADEYRNSNSTPRKKENLYQIMLLFVEKRRARLQKALTRADHKDPRVNNPGSLANNVLTELITREANLTMKNFS